MKETKYRLILVSIQGQQIENEYLDVETARKTGKEWLQKHWARGFFIERA